MNTSKIEEYKEYLSTGLEKAKPLILESLLEYYKGYYKREIISRFCSINYFFYFNEAKYKDLISHRNNTYSFDAFKLNKDYKRIKKEIINSTKWCDKDNKLKRKYIYSTVDINLFDSPFLNSVDEYCIKRNINCMETIMIDDNYFRLVFSPIFFASDGCLIHEIVHAIMAEPLLQTVDEDDNIIDNYDKCGLIVKSDNRYLEEAITEIEAREIYKIFKEKGGNFLDQLYYSKKFDCSYHILDPLVIPFYNKYKEKIIHSRITLNTNALVQMCGKEEYENYSKSINDCYKEYPKETDMIDYIYLSKSLIKKMDENVKRLERTL